MSRRLAALTCRAIALIAGAAAAACCRADMDEAWLARAGLPDDLHPLLAVIIDRSDVTTESLAVDEAYDPARNYGADLPAADRCAPAKVYWRRGPGPAPDCGRQAGLDNPPVSDATGFQCESARASLAQSGFFIASRAAQWRIGGGGGYWTAPHADGGEALECRADRGHHGAAPGIWYASDSTGAPWTGNPAQEIAWNRPPFADSYIFYAGNFLNYLRTARAAVQGTAADIMARRMAQALAATDELDVALIRVDDDGPDGGYVARAPVASSAAAAEIAASVAVPPAAAAPLAETLAEAASWLQGGHRRFGSDRRADPAASMPSAPGTYRSPFDHACRPVSLAYLTAGVASDDDQAASAASALPHFREQTGGCDTDCLAALGAWLGSTDLRDDLPGVQTAPVSWITTIPAPPAISGHIESLTDPLAFINLVAGAFQHDAAAAADPQLSAAGISPFDVDAGQPAIVFGLSAPGSHERWAGNLLRYALRPPAGPLDPPRIVDRDGIDAIDGASGLPRPNTRSAWSDAPDVNLLAGGAAGRLPPAGRRRIYTDIAGSRLTDPANRLEPGNRQILRATVGLGPTDPETLDEALDWPSMQRTLGDPGLHAPAIVDYPASGQRIVYAATHDGMVHAFDAGSGVELWAFMPKELLPRIPALMRDSVTSVRGHAIDGPLVLHRLDTDGDGRISPTAGEHLWLLFGLGRGGNHYYALDIASPDDPRMLWSFELPDATVESLAEPVITRLAIKGSGQSAGNWVALLAGGYDPRFDSNHAAGLGAGNALHVVDALTGRHLWSAGGTDGDVEMPEMASLPSAPRALDLDGDGILDRAYLLDVAGSLWRLDFETGRDAGALAQPRRLARLGTGAQRFYSPPDVSVEYFGNESRLAIAVGSGWLTRPRDAAVQDRLYVVTDRVLPAASRELSDADLHDATDAGDALPADAPGWFVRLDAHGPGEKVVGSTVTLDHILRFQTYQPLAPEPSAPCGPPRSVSRRYALDVRTARPQATAVEREEDEPREIAAAGLPVGMRFGFPGRWQDVCAGCRPRPFGIIGGETFDPGYAGDPVRTSWRKLTPPPVTP